MKSAIFSGLFAALVSVVSAQAETFAPETNPIAVPELGKGYPVGSPVEIKWAPNTAGPVKIVLLKGPSTNVVDIGTISASTANSGSYSWTPEASLEHTGTEGYGIKIVDIPTGKFQYSVQFGIQNDKPATPEPTKPATETPETSETPEEPIKNDYAAGAEGSVVYSTHTSTVTVCPCTAGVAAPSGTGYINPQVNVTTPEYVVPNVSATQPSEPIYTGAASQVKAGGVFVAAFVAMAVML
jgi:hypothetical protein